MEHQEILTYLLIVEDIVIQNNVYLQIYILKQKSIIFLPYTVAINKDINIAIAILKVKN